MSVKRHEFGHEPKRFKDVLVAEEPFTVVWQSLDGASERLASTMRTPGDDLSLAAGMLLSEGLLTGKHELKQLSFCAGGGVNELNRLKAELRLSRAEIQERLSHRPSAGLPQSACGMCALDDLSSPETLLKWSASRYHGKPAVADRELLLSALRELQSGCPLFSQTGASHATAVLAADGTALKVAEDVGRHNACDKALGGLLLESDGRFQLPPHTGVLFSSRLSFELASKAAVAGAAWIASVGAPTHLAVALAHRLELPLYGFVSEERFNQYSGL